jgi:glycosyltransferase involved in cell wall biosynthesis
MKIFYIANARIPTEKAHGVQIMKMCEAFANLNHEVVLIVPRRVSHIAGNAFVYYGLKPSFEIVYLPTLDLIRWSDLIPKLLSVLQSWSFARAVRRYLGHHQSDLIYTRDELSARGFPPGAPVFLEVHNISRTIRRSVQPLAKRLQRIVVISHGLREALERLGYPAEKIIVLPDGVDLKQFQITESKTHSRQQLGLPQDKQIIMYTGNFFAWKGVYVLAEAARSFADDYLFVLVGGSPHEMSAFKKYLGEKLHQPGNIMLVGHISYDKIPQYLNAADVLVLPNSAKAEISSLYTSPLKLFEYLAIGRPIVAADLPSVREIVSKSQVEFTRPDDPVALAQAIRRAQARDFSENRNFVWQYSWQERVLHILASIDSSRKIK